MHMYLIGIKCLALDAKSMSGCTHTDMHTQPFIKQNSNMTRSKKIRYRYRKIQLHKMQWKNFHL